MENEKHYTPFQNFIIRTPLFPLSFLKELTTSKVISDDKIKLLCRQPVIAEAIFIASPPLYYELQKWLNNTEESQNKKKAKKTEKLKESIVKYLLRMATRCTPFGLFAGITTGKIEKNTDIFFSSISYNISHTRLDMNYLCALALDLSKQENVRKKILFYPNSSIYTVGDQIRYVEYEYVNSRRMHHISAVDNSEYLQRILQKAIHGASLNDLANSITDNEITNDEAYEFVNEVIDSQLLISELEPTVTGMEYLKKIIRIIEKINGDNKINEKLKLLKEVDLKLESLKKNSIGRPVSFYENITKKLDNFQTKYDLKYLFQTDMVKKAEKCTLSETVVNDIQKGIEVLNRLTVRNPENNLSKFRTAFVARYEEEEIPLLQALDTETGIGYLQNSAGDIAPLVDDLYLPVKNSETSKPDWNNRWTFLTKKYIETVSSNKKTVELTDEDISAFNSNWDDLPETIAAMIQVFGKEDNAFQIYIKSVGGSSAANLIGRFCHADKKALNLVNEIIKKDEGSNSRFVFAEIVHLPESRIGNILSRPEIRKYEIPYLAKSSVPEPYQLTPDDLYISVRGEQIFIRSKRLNKFVIPRLTTAHNYSFNALPVYQFLCDFQTQNVRGGLSFNWGPVIANQSFLPRVTYNNIILSRATWNIASSDTKPIFKLKEKEKQIDEFLKLAEKIKLPDEILLIDNDNELYINLHNRTSVRILLNQIKNRSSFALTEFLFSQDNLIAKGNEGGFTNEFIVPFFKNHHFKNEL